MGRKLFWWIVTLGGVVVGWWWLERRETRGFRPEPPPRPADSVRRCIAVTQNGTRCSREALEGSDLCWQHV